MGTDHHHHKEPRHNDDDVDALFFAAEENQDCAGNSLQNDNVPHTTPIFLPFQQMSRRDNQFPCSEEIIFHDLEKVVKSSGTLIRKHTTPSHCLDEEMQSKEIHEDEVLEDDYTVQESKQQKRKRTIQSHNLNERLRRQKIQDKMKALQELIPNCDKRDKAYVLDEAVKYIKTLQYQAQEHQMMMMSSMRASGFSRFQSPPMPMPMPQHAGMMQIPTLPQFPPIDNPTGIEFGNNGIELGVGIGMGMGTRMGNGTPMSDSGLPSPFALESSVSGLSASSSSIQNLHGNDYALPPWHGISFPTSVSQCTTSPSQGTTTARLLPSELVRAHAVVNGNRSSQSGSSERDTSSSIARFQGYL